MREIFCVIFLFLIVGFCKAEKLFDCEDGNFVAFWKICDGKRDCPSFADEIPELCKNWSCPSSFIKCRSGACVEDQKECEEVENIIGISDVSDLDGIVLKMEENVYCPAISSTRHIVHCIRNGELVPCDQNVLPGTNAVYRCEEPFEATKSSTQATTCRSNGKWSREITPCEPKCGYLGSAVPLIVYAEDANSPLPWHVSMFLRKSDRWKYACGGTLITESLILSAAHCFTGVSENDIKFFTGKIHNNITISDDEPNANVYNVKRIFKHPLYLDKIGNYGSDIAIVQLIGSIEFNDYIHPICIDWKLEKIIAQLQNGSMGLATGMGITETQRASENIRMLQMPVVSDQECIELQSQDFRKYIRMTTFCAGWANGTGLCNGDSGGGLVFPNEDQTRWYIQGIVSLSPRRVPTFFCDPNKYTVFTKVAIYLHWVRLVIDHVHSPYKIDADFSYEPIL